MIRTIVTIGAAASACLMATSAQGAVKSSVFDDVKVWYKGSAGNAVGMNDDGHRFTVQPPPRGMAFIIR